MASLDTDSSSTPRQIPPRTWSTSHTPSLSDFKDLCSQTCTRDDYPLASAVEKNIPIYDVSRVSPRDAAAVSRLQDEWHAVLLSGPGVFVVRHLYADVSLLERTNAAFDRIIAEERSAGAARGDHFAASAANSRIWNSFSKHCLADSASFAAYYANPWLAHLCTCWLGPGYRITAQANIVRPGGEPQVAHRDYHLGFQGAAACAAFPRATQVASQLLTLQGAVAHSEMPLHSGPTRFLPYSQLLPEGYMAYRRDEFRAYFTEAWVSLPLKVGDGVFFNPALFHAAGRNESADVHRSANLLQVSSALGKPMESIDGVPLVEACWGHLQEMSRGGKDAEVQALAAALGEGYPFPTNLDRRPPAPGGMAPESEVEVLLRGIRQGWTTEEAVARVRQLREDSRA